MEKISRRKWLGHSAALGASLVLTPQLGFAKNPVKKDNGYIRLNANENPFGPSEKAIEAIKSSFSESNRYPVAYAEALVEALAKKEKLAYDQILLGAGSTELLQQLGQWVLQNSYHLTYASPSFEIISNYVNHFGGKLHKTQLNNAQQHDLDALCKMSAKNPGVVYIVNPNNPTGTKLNKADLIDFCETVSNHSYIIIDEAYIEYAGEEESLKELTSANEKIIVLRTFSKIYGLAGLRIGYLLAHPKTIKLLSPYQIWKHSSLNNVGIQAAMASLNDTNFINTSREKNKECLHFTQNELSKLGIPTIDSYTNFLWFDSTRYQGILAGNLHAHGIRVRELVVGKKTWVRVSMGTLEEMKRFIEVTKSIWY